jgi:hypothetical protein
MRRRRILCRPICPGGPSQDNVHCLAPLTRVSSGFGLGRLLAGTQGDLWLTCFLGGL